jgi:hypothetical protein
MKEKPRSRRAPSGLKAQPTAEPAELEEQLTLMTALLERNEVQRARDLIRVLETRWPQSDRVRHLARTLAPPVTRLLPDVRGRSRQKERDWLHRHAQDYPNHWLALLEDHLIAADPDVRVVVAAMRQRPGAETALLHYQPGPRD